MTLDPALRTAAEAWRDQDPDAVTRAELDALLAAAGTDDDAAAALAERFSGRLAFGTAGLRGELGAGPTRMNRVLVAQAAAGLAAYLLEASGGERPTAVIGYDGRTNSSVFARDTAELMAGAGVRAILLPRLLPTPVLAFAVRHLGASAGVMVTASHNPARDNGYKVYLGGADGGSQIVPPADGAIAARIARVAAGDIRTLPRSDAFEVAPEEVVDAYVAAAAASGRANVGADAGADAAADAGTDPAAPRFVYTAMHGVGFETARRVFAAAGLGEPVVVEEQRDPDPAFPTVAFPNPEEEGALDLALALASATDAQLVVANDPDADRLAIAIPDAAGWRRLSGNEVGALLGWAAARAQHETGGHGGLAASLVSSPALLEVAESYDLPFTATLTGFKWISRVPGLAFGFEEALGYLVNPGDVRDKDGISAATAFLRLAAALAARGSSVAEHLRDFDETFGAFASAQVSIRVTDLARIGELLAGLRASPPAHIGRVRVLHVDDFLDGVDGFEPQDILRFRLEHGARVIVRGSGTEPKLKVYIDASSTDGTVETRRRAAGDLVADLEHGIRSLLG
ncbi:phospho-sugar mutase [Galbitalea sp. SE-J8]|uniref:phospho-sugar mutase n=1 Tax=Galbitalea sp. SE-J8 TaxID=3054952 RepID=UPI00259D2C0A|nr:phospho-sugar mutase [Galbitalea sp. SE-J8]MDM4762746.1 phospho-sugar mutase [Galbitalea sp. SE-J8]